MGKRVAVVCVALVATACAGGGDAGNETTDAADASASTAATAQGATTAPGAVSNTVEGTTSTSTAASSIVWSRAPDDVTVFGGEGDQIMQSVTPGGPGLVAVGWDVGLRSGAVWTSPDGVTWTRVPHDEAIFGGDGDQFISSVVSGGAGLVAVGTDARGLDRFAAVWTSPDGTTWTRVPHGPAFEGDEGIAQMFDVTVGGPGLVAVGYNGFDDRDAAVWTSPDGLTWTRVPHDEALFGGALFEEMAAVTTGEGAVVAVGREAHPLGDDRNAVVWTSSDGLTWTRLPHDEAVFGGDDWQELTDVAAGGPGFVAIGSDWGAGTQVWTSPDGSVWSRVPFDEPTFGRGTPRALSAGGSGLVVVGDEFSGGAEGDSDAAVWTSTDGTTWSRIPHDEEILGGDDNQEMLGVAFGGPGLVAVGTDGVIVDGDLDGAVWLAQG